MSEESDRIMAVDLEYVNAHYWNSTGDSEVMKSESSDPADIANRSEDEPISEPISELVSEHDGSGAGGDDAFSHAIDVQDCQERLQIIQDRVTRIVGRMTSLTESLRHMHVGLKQNNKLEVAPLPEREQNHAMGDVGSTQTDPPIKPNLNMLAERIGDSVACQTIEDSSMAQ